MKVIIGSEALLLGWDDGIVRPKERKNMSPRPENLKYAEFHIVNESVCIQAWRPHNITKSHICAQGNVDYYVSKVFFLLAGQKVPFFPLRGKNIQFLTSK